MRAWWLAAVLVSLPALGRAAEPRLVDSILAEVGSRPVTLSDVTLARALGVFGLEPSAGPITEAEVTTYLDAQLVAREARQLDIEVPAADLDRAWEQAGGAALAARLAEVGVDPGWARRQLEDDLRIDRFVEVRFAAFAFVTDFDVEEALGPGQHDQAARAATRDRLRAEMIARAFAAWRQDARARTPIRPLPGVTGPWLPPFTLRVEDGPRR
jgi:hypothetical protein